MHTAFNLGTDFGIQRCLGRELVYKTSCISYIFIQFIGFCNGPVAHAITSVIALIIRQHHLATARV